LDPKTINSPFQLSFAEIPFCYDLNAAELWKSISNRKIEARYISPFAVILHKDGTYPRIEKATWIGHFCIIDGSQGLEIGEFCEISCGVHIYTHTTHLRCTRRKEKQVAPVKIGKHVFIGANSIISMGCNIEDNSMVAPLSFVGAHTHIPQWHLYAGQPAIKKGDMRDHRQ